MGILNSAAITNITKGINKAVLIKGLMEQFAPNMLEDKLGETAKGKSVKEFYDFLDSGSLWSTLSSKHQQWLVAHKPWNLDWLTIEWVVEAIAKSNQTICMLILSSPDVKEKLEKDILQIKQMLG